MFKLCETLWYYFLFFNLSKALKFVKNMNLKGVYIINSRTAIFLVWTGISGSEFYLNPDFLRFLKKNAFSLSRSPDPPPELKLSLIPGQSKFISGMSVKTSSSRYQSITTHYCQLLFLGVITSESNGFKTTKTIYIFSVSCFPHNPENNIS